MEQRVQNRGHRTSKNTRYAHIVEYSNYKEKVRRLLKEQQGSVIKELLAGK